MSVQYFAKVKSPEEHEAFQRLVRKRPASKKARSEDVADK